jgi:hypothetical protein
MNAEKIVAIAAQLKCGPSEVAVSFARMIAEHCAQLAEEDGAARSGVEVAALIREEFRVADEHHRAPSGEGRPAAEV